MRISLDLTWLSAPRSVGTPRLRHVWWSLLALLHTRASCTSGTVSSAADPDSLSRVFSLWTGLLRYIGYPGDPSVLSALPA